MKRNSIALFFLSCVVLFNAFNVGAAESKPGAPRIQFETNFCDFGPITGMESVSGSFKFKNTGDDVLKVEPPQASCECTEPRVVPDTIAPGQSGEIIYTVELDRPISGERIIYVRSNDPENRSMQLRIALQYTHLFDLQPRSLGIALPAGQNEMKGTVVVSRTDKKPLGIEKLETSQDWITAEFDPVPQPQDTSGRINVTVHRPKMPPAPFKANVHLWITKAGKPQPAQNLPVSGEIFGELAATPSQLYWVIPAFGTNRAAYPEESLTRKIQLTSVLGKEVHIDKVSTDIKNMTVKLVPQEGKDAGKKFELILKFEQLPETFANGKVVVETPLPSLPRLEVPMTIAVAN